MLKLLTTLSRSIGHRLARCPIHLLLSIFLLSLSTTSLASKLHWQSSDYIIDSFIDIALNNEYSSKISRLRKWDRPIYYTIKHRTADRALHQKITTLHLAHLADITGMKIAPATSKNRTNLTIVFSTQATLKSDLKKYLSLTNKKQIAGLIRRGVCLAAFSTRTDSSIHHATIIIPVDRARARAKLLSCVVEELTQIMGLPNDSDRVFPSIFNDKSHDDFLSGLDYLLLKLLYHPKTKPGMNTYQLKRVLRKIIAGNTFQQLIGESERVVHQQGLFPLLNN